MTAPHPAQNYADAHGFPTEDRTLAPVADALACVYSGAGEFEASALRDALEDRGLTLVCDRSATRIAATDVARDRPVLFGQSDGCASDAGCWT